MNRRYKFCICTRADTLPPSGDAMHSRIAAHTLYVLITLDVLESSLHIGLTVTVVVTVFPVQFCRALESRLVHLVLCTKFSVCIRVRHAVSAAEGLYLNDTVDLAPSSDLNISVLCYLILAVFLALYKNT